MSLMQAVDNDERERERDFYLTPARPGFGHMAAGAVKEAPS